MYWKKLQARKSIQRKPQLWGKNTFPPKTYQVYFTRQLKIILHYKLDCEQLHHDNLGKTYTFPS